MGSQMPQRKQLSDVSDWTYIFNTILSQQISVYTYMNRITVIMF